MLTQLAYTTISRLKQFFFYIKCHPVTTFTALTTVSAMATSMQTRYDMRVHFTIPMKASWTTQY